MSEPNEMKFERLETKFSVKNYLKSFKERMNVVRSEEVKVGEVVSIDLPNNEQFHFLYIGERPEKCDIVGNKLTVCMPRTALIFLHEAVRPGRISNPKAELFVAS